MSGAGDGSRTRDLQLGRPERLGALALWLEGRAYRVVKDTVRHEIGLAQKAA